MLAIDEVSLMNEVRDAEKERDVQLSILADITRRMAGKYYRVGESSSDTPENYIFSYLSFTKPQIAFAAPSVVCEAVRSVADTAFAEGQAAVLNYWMKETNFDEPLDDVALDTLLLGGVMMATVESRGDYQSGGLAAVGGDFEQSPFWVDSQRISLRDFIMDGQCTDGRKARILGHKFERDLNDLQQDERYDQEVIKDLAGEEKDARQDANDPFPSKLPKESKRKVVTLYQLYIPEHAKVITLAEKGPGGAGVIVRNVAYFGPDEGPYTMFQIYKVPDRVWPLSALIATFEQFLEVQTHAMAAADEASTQKSFAVAKKSRAADAEAVKTAKSGDVLLLDEPDSVRDMKIGGTTQARVDYLDMATNKYERDLGFADAQHGISNSDTATANQLAQQNSDLRMDYCKQRFSACTRKHLDKIRWYMWNLEGFRMSFVHKDELTGQPVDMTFIGGDWQGGWVRGEYVPPQAPDLDYSGFAIDIKVGSMNKEDDAVAQKRAQDEVALCMQLESTGKPINWRRVMDRYGQRFNEKDYSKIVFLDPMEQMVPGDPLAQMQQPPQSFNQPYPQPRHAQPAVGQSPQFGAGPGAGTQFADLSREATAGA